MVLLNIAAGIALILFGIRFLRKGLDRVLGYDLHVWLERMARNRWRAAAAGAFFGTVAPSSTAQTLLTLQLVKAGKLPLESTLAFLLGANAGITVTVQLIAVRVFDAYGAFLVVGFIGFNFFRGETWRGVGQAILGLGFVFLAMSIISRAAHEMAGDPAFLTVLGLLADHRVFVLFFSAALTLISQSSTATIGLALALAGTGQLSLGLVLPVVLGANLGIGLTSLAAGYFTTEGRWLAAMNLAIKGLIILPALLAFPSVVAAAQLTPGDVSRQAANFHSAFGVLAAFLGVILGKPLGALLRRVVRPKRVGSTLGNHTTYLDAAALSTPKFALANATRETLRLGDEVKAMLENAWFALESRDLELARRVQKHDDRVDEVHTAIKQYLSQLPLDAMTPRDAHLQFGLLNFVSQLEVIGDVLDKTICAVVEKSVQKPVPFADSDKLAMREMYSRLHGRLQTALSVLAMRDRELAQAFLADGERLKEWCIETQRQHYHRLQNITAPEALEASDRFIDVINALRRINGLLNTIGHTFTLEPSVPSDG